MKKRPEELGFSHATVFESHDRPRKDSVLCENGENVASSNAELGYRVGDLCNADLLSICVARYCIRCKMTIAGKGEKQLWLPKNSLWVFLTLPFQPRDGYGNSDPVLPPNTGVFFTKYSRFMGIYALASVGGINNLDKKRNYATMPEIGLSGVATRLLERKKAEEVLKGKKITEALLLNGRVAKTEIGPCIRIEGSADYKRELADFLKRVGRKPYRELKGYSMIMGEHYERELNIVVKESLTIFL